MNARRSFNLLLYASLAFLAVYLYRNDLLRWPTVVRPWWFGSSFAVLCVAFVVHAETWRIPLKVFGWPVRFADSTASTGLSIFAKYIPGKLWTILGRSEYIAALYGYPRTQLATLSLNRQFISLWVGLLLGTIGMYAVGGTTRWGHLVLVLFLALSMILYVDAINRLVERMASRVLGRPIDLPKLSAGQTLRVLPVFAANWLLWCAGFHMLAQGMVEDFLPWHTGLSFALAGSLGILAIIAPGGIGVRESIFVGYFLLVGIEAGVATSIAVTSRLWFLAGEAFIFGIGWIMRRRPARPRGDDPPGPTSAR